MVLFLLVFALEYIRHEVGMYYLFIYLFIDILVLMECKRYGLLLLSSVLVRSKKSGIIELVFEPPAKNLDMPIITTLALIMALHKLCIEIKTL